MNVDKLQAEAKRAAEQWHAEHSDIAKLVRAKLDARVNEVIAKLLGFENSWGEWRVDHCNGRSGDSAAGDFMRKRAGAAVNGWLSEQAGELPKLPKQAVASLKKEYLRCVESTLRDLLRKRADVDAVAMFEMIAEEALAEDGECPTS